MTGRDLAPASVPGPASDAPRERRVMLVNPGWPRHDRDAGSARLMEIVRALRDLGSQVVFVPREPEDEQGYGDDLRALGAEVLRLSDARPRGQAARRAAYRVLRASLRERPCDAVIAFHHRTARHVLPHVRRADPGCLAVTDCVDLHFLRLAREAALTGDVELARAAERERVRELATYAASDLVLAIHEEEQALLEHRLPGTAVATLPLIVPEGDGGLPRAERRGLFFVGSFGHPPNADALRVLADEVLPELAQSHPDLRLAVAGGGAEAHLERVPSNLDLLGFVPSLEPALRGSLALVAPLRFGAGAKGKVAQALAWGLPVITTSVGAEGLGLTDGEDVLLAEDGPATARAVRRLVGDPDLWERLSRAGRAHARTTFGPERARAVLRREVLDPVRLAAARARPGRGPWAAWRRLRGRSTAALPRTHEGEGR